MIDNLSALVERKLLPAGAAYLAHVRRQVHNLSHEEIDRQAEEERKRLAAANGDDNGEDDLGVGEEEESEELLAQDAKEWKVRAHFPKSRSIPHADEWTETRSLRSPWPVPSEIQSNTRANQGRS